MSFKYRLILLRYSLTDSVFHKDDNHSKIKLTIEINPPKFLHTEIVFHKDICHINKGKNKTIYVYFIKQKLFGYSPSSVLLN